uniref:UPF0556 protein C19orf10 homolog n=1 Tax=Schistocephalus solidus TaxID=70667 RepID=A0A0X3PPC6_SCHSO
MTVIVGTVQFFLVIWWAVIGRAEYLRQIVVKPGGVFHKESIERDGVTCVFEYRCQGGTGENWDLSLMEGISKGHAVCHAQRSGATTSYLYFQEFALRIEGPAELITGQAYSRTENPLSADEFLVDPKKKQVSQVNGKFKNALVHASAEYVHLNKREL